MAYENLNSTVSNFCRSPVVGSWCIVDSTDSTNPMLITKNESGGLVDSHYILGGINFSNFICIEYVGPGYLSYYYDGLDFITLEKVSDTSCIIKFMEINDTFKTLDLREELILKDFADYSFDALSMAVEYADTFITVDTPGGRNYIQVDDITQLIKGMRLFLGPSTDPDSLDECEVVVISSIVPINNRVYLTSFLKNEYLDGNKVSFCRYVYLISKKGMAGNVDSGAIIKIDLMTKYIVNFDSDPVYKRLTLAKWCPYLKKIAFLYTCNVLYIDPYNYYTVSRSQFLGNFRSTGVDFYTIYDIAFKDMTLYKLSKEVTIKDDEGIYSTYSWNDKYNYQRDSLIPYVANIGVYSDDFHTTGDYDTTILFFKATDQFGVGLRDVVLDAILLPGDFSATTTPLSGEMLTDIDGLSNIIYNQGTGLYDGITTVKVSTLQGSPFTGSSKVIGTGKVISSSKIGYKSVVVKSLTQFVSENKNTVKQVKENTVVISMRCFSFFSSQGGNWSPPPLANRSNFDLLWYFGPSIGVFNGLTMYNQDGGMSLTLQSSALAPGRSIEAYGIYISNNPSSISNRVTTIKDYKNRVLTIQISEYLMTYPIAKNPMPHNTNISQKLPVVHSSQLSQLFHSRHSYWMDSIYTDYTSSNVRLNQFIFVQDAIPVFWSRKNTTDTKIWLRLRPFAASLDATTIVMKVREETPLSDTGYIDISNAILTDGFDAGSGLFGIEVTYFPPVYFKHNAIIYVYLSVRDTVGNLIKISYWFTIIRDYLGPYLDNLYPDINETGVAVTTSISFDIKDDGAGVDISTFEMNVNSLIVTGYTINKVTNNYYRIDYSPSYLFMNGKEVVVSLHVSDLSEEKNWLHYGYRFYTAESSSVLFTEFNPVKCTYGVSRFSDVSFMALDGGSGVDKDKLRLQVHDIDVTDHPYTTILPIIYRVL